MTEELREGLLENEPGAQSKKSNRIRRVVPKRIFAALPDCAGIEQQMPTDIFFLHMHTLYITIYLPPAITRTCLYISLLPYWWLRKQLLARTGLLSATLADVPESKFVEQVKLLCSSSSLDIRILLYIHILRGEAWWSFNASARFPGFPSPDQQMIEDRKGIFIMEYHGILE